MIHNEEQFENYLKEFQPRHPRALPNTACAYWLHRLAAAAILVFALVTSIWFSFRSSNQTGSQFTVNNNSVRPSQPTRSPFALTREAVENPDHLDTLLETIPNHRLPRFDQENSALHILAKE